MTGPAPQHLTRLTAALGMPALEASWERVTGQPLPPNVRSYVEAHLHDAADPKPAPKPGKRKRKRRR